MCPWRLVQTHSEWLGKCTRRALRTLVHKHRGKDMEWKTAKRVSRLALGAVFFLAIIWEAARWLTSSLYGVFTLFVILYFGLPMLGWQPLSPSELLEWLAKLPRDAKIAAITSGITILGFLAAFWSGHYLWKRQTSTQLRLQMMEEIDSFFRKTLAAVRVVDRSHRLVVDTLREHQASPLPSITIEARTKLLNGYLTEYMSAKKQIGTSLSEIHDLRTKHLSPLATTRFGLYGFENSANFLQELSGRVYILFPTFEISPHYFLQMASQLDHARIDDLSGWLQVRGAMMLGGVGGIRGAVHQAVFGSPVSSLYTIRKSFDKWFSDDGALREAFDVWQKSKKNVS